MVSREDSEAKRQASSRLENVDVQSTNLPWDEPPFCWLNPQQQVELKTQAETLNYSLGEKIWFTEAVGYQLLVVSGKVRLREEETAKPLALLRAGDWFGDLLELSGQFKAVAASKEVVVVRWKATLWTETSSPEIERFWKQLRSSYQPQISDAPQPVSGYPFVSSPNTAAACLTMVTQQLQSPAQFDWVQRQLRGKRPKHLVEAGEKLGLQLKRLLVNWHDLRQLSFPALLHWEQEYWVVVYGIKGDRLIIANPLHLSQTCESLPRSIVEPSWNGQLWQVEPIQRQEKFNLSWFLPAVWHYRGLLSEVLLASFTLQLLGLGTPIITQVIIDKVMVQQSLPTLDVMAIALLSIAIFEAVLGILRLFVFTHTARRQQFSF